MKSLGPEMEMSLLIFGTIARSGLVKCAGDATQLANKIMQNAKEQGFVITQEKVDGKALKRG